MLNRKRIKNKEFSDAERRIEKREKINTPVNFFIDADITKAKSVDISDSGICFETAQPLSMHIRMDANGMVLEQVARLIWCKRKKNGEMTYGLEFNKDCRGFQEKKL